MFGGMSKVFCPKLGVLPIDPKILFQILNKRKNYTRICKTLLKNVQVLMALEQYY